MAFSAHKTTEAMEEIEESKEQLQQHAKEVAELIIKSNYTVFYTGAGVSTSAGIPDYRGPEGVWTLEAQHRKRENPTTDLLQAIPTPTHMSLVALHRAGKLQCLISSNVDGLHGKSGIPSNAIAEVHGNTCVEECCICGKRYLRDYSVTLLPLPAHRTGRKCIADGCGGDLCDTIINFGENLPMKELEQGFKSSELADVQICLGSSLTVSPSCDMPRTTHEKGGKLVIVNLQRTPLDSIADVRVHARCDEFMQAVMKNLYLSIPSFALERTAVLWRGEDDSNTVSIVGVDDDGTPQTLFDHVILRDGRRFMHSNGPIVCTEVGSGDEVEMECHFFRHYREPPVRLGLAACQNLATFKLKFSPTTGTEWFVSLPSAESKASATAKPSFRKGQGPSRALPATAPVEEQLGPEGWFSVTPEANCPHCQQAQLTEGATFDISAPCQQCGNVGENMQCMVCHVVMCGRHVSQHMISHYEETRHPLVIGFKDLSIWCYPCECYISPNNRHVRAIHRLLYKAKFDTEE